MRVHLMAVVAALCLLGAEKAEAGKRRCVATPVCCTPCAPVCCTPCVPAVSHDVTATRTVTREVTRTAASSADGCSNGTCRQRTVSVTRTSSVAQAKANQLAARGQVFHPGGSLGGGSHEGCGYGMTADAAVRSCCFWGQRTPIDIGTAQGANGGWYAVVLYR